MLMLLRAYVIFMGAFFLWALVVMPDMDTSFRSAHGVSQSRSTRQRETARRELASRSQDPWTEYAETTQQLGDGSAQKDSKSPEGG